jgi:hypothetical protein
LASVFEIILILVLTGACLLFPIFDRRAIRRFVKEQTGHDVEVPKDRLIYRIFQLFGLGFAAGGFASPPVLGTSALEGGFLGGVIGVLGSLVIKLIRRRREKKAAKEPSK